MKGQKFVFIKWNKHALNDAQTHVDFYGNLHEILTDQEGQLYIHPPEREPLYLDEVSQPKEEGEDNEGGELFTPGKWEPSFSEIDEENYSIDIHASDLQWWVASAKFGQVDKEEAKANATLIAAAPDMYYALKKANEIIERLCSDYATVAGRHANYTNGEAKIIESALQKANPKQ